MHDYSARILSMDRFHNSSLLRKGDRALYRTASFFSLHISVLFLSRIDILFTVVEGIQRSGHIHCPGACSSRTEGQLGNDYGCADVNRDKHWSHGYSQGAMDTCFRQPGANTGIKYIRYKLR